MSPDGRIAGIAARQHGAFTHRQARASGLTQHAIAHRRHSGRWTDLHRRVYAVAGAPNTKEQRVMAAVLALGARAVAASLTAAWLHGLTDPPSGTVHLLMPMGQHRRWRPGIVIGEARLARTDVQRIAGIPVTGPTRTVVDVAGAVHSQTLERLLDAAIVRGLTTPASLQQYVQGRRLRRNRGAAALARLLRDRLGGTPESELERTFIRKLRASHLPEPARQHRVGKRRIDFAYLRDRIAIELDGLHHHFTAAAFRSDRQRQNELVLAGWTPYRFTWEDVTANWPSVEGTIRRALRM